MTTQRLPRPQRVAAVFARNVKAASHPSYLWVLLSGLFEPIFYLGAIGIGVGSFIGTLSLDGKEVLYTSFVAPAMLAVSMMSGSMAEATFNFYTKLQEMRLFDATACTPLTAAETVCGEVLWSVARGTVHSIPFLMFMYAFDMIDGRRIPLVFAATVLIGFTFAAVGIAVSTFLRSKSGFDQINLFVFGMFIFSGTFVPVSEYPNGVRQLVEVVPLFHAVELVRDVTAGLVTWASIGSLAYLVAMGGTATFIACRRMNVILHS